MKVQKVIAPRAPDVARECGCADSWAKGWYAGYAQAMERILKDEIQQTMFDQENAND